MRLRLADVKPIEGDTWPENVTEYLKRHLFNKKVKVIPFSKIEGDIPTYTACILRNETNINANLVSKNFATSTGKQ